MHHYNYSLTELESMIPWEKDIYLELLRQHVENENNRIANQNNMNRAFNSRGRRL